MPPRFESPAPLTDLAPASVIAATPSAFALLLTVGRQPQIRVAPVLVAPLARLALKWLRNHQPAVFSAVITEFTDVAG